MNARTAALLFPPAPALRLSLLRALVGAFATGYLLLRAGNLVSVTAFHAREFRPIGVARVLSEPLPAPVVYASVLLACLAGVAFTLGFRFRWLGPLFALLLLWVTSYRSSWGMIFHTDNLVTLHVGVLSLSPAAAVWSWDARRSPAPAPLEEHGRYGWAIRTMALVTACAYVVAGVAKLKLSGGAWLGGELLRAQIAFDNLRKIELGSGYSALGVWLIRHRALFPPLSWLTLALELGAPLALLGRRAALVWCALAWSFHVGVALLMHIGFPYPLSLLAYLPLFRVERLLELGPLRRFAIA